VVVIGESVPVRLKLILYLAAALNICGVRHLRFATPEPFLYWPRRSEQKEADGEEQRRTRKQSRFQHAKCRSGYSGLD